jgi:hypothetical protein
MSDETFLLFIGVCEDAGLLMDQGLLGAVLMRLPELVGMQIIREPVVGIARGNPGLEGYVPIDTSNITLSTYTCGNRIVGCIHSCRRFDIDPILTYIRNQYVCTRLAYKLVSENEMAGDSVR